MHATGVGRAAFSNAVLLEPRWLLGGRSMDNKIRSSHTWSNILEINGFKQALFVERVLWLHDLASRRSKGRT